MRRLSVVLLALLCAGAAWAGDGQLARPDDRLDLNGVLGPDGRWYSQSGTTGGGLNIGNPEQGWIYYHPSIIQNSKRAPGPFLANNSAACLPDSSAPLICQGATRVVLWFYPTFDDSTIAVALGVSLRAHPQQSADSLTTFTRLMRRNGPIVTGTSGGVTRDSIGSLVDYFNPSVYPDTTRLPGEEVLILGHKTGPRGFGIEFAWSSYSYSVLLRYLNVLITSAEGIGWAARDPATTIKVDAYWYR